MADFKIKNNLVVQGTTATINGDTVTTNTASQTLTNKTIDAASNTITNIPNSSLSSGIDAAKIADGSVSNTEFQRLNGVTSDIQTQLDSKIPNTEKGSALGVATLDAGGKVPVAQLPNSVMEYKGVWNATTNTPTLADGAGNTGDVYRVSVAGTQDLGSGNISFDVGDYAIYNGSTWEKSDTTDAVASVNGLTGVVVLDTDDISEGSNLYFTDERAQDAVGTILTNSTKIDFTYNDGTPSITATIVAGSLVNADISASAAIDATKIADGSVSNTEFETLNGVTSSIQTQLDGKANTTLNNLAADVSLAVETSTSVNTNSGTVSIGTGNSDDATGDAYLYSGAPVNADENSGIVDLSTGDVTGTGVSGNISVATGTSVNGNSGNITLTTGTPSGSGTRGSINVSALKLDMGSAKITSLATPTVSTDAATKGYVDSLVTASPGDITETSMSIANNQASPANVTGLAFANATVRSFRVHASVIIDATADLFEVYELIGIQKGSSWDMSQSSTGDDAGLTFSITNAGQIQYTSTNNAGFVSGTLRFRAITTTV